MNSAKKIICPNCGSRKGFRKIQKSNEAAGCATLLFGGLFPFLTFAESNNKNMLCENCNILFSAKRLSTADWIIAILFIVILIGIIVISAGYTDEFLAR